MGELIHLKNAALPAFLKEAKYQRFADVAFFKRMINFSIQYGGMDYRDIADLNGVATNTVRGWGKTLL